MSCITGFKTIAIDTPGGNLSLVKNIKAQTTALNSFNANLTSMPLTLYN